MNHRLFATLLFSGLSPFLGGCLLGHSPVSDEPGPDFPILWQAGGNDLMIQKGFNLVIRDQAGLSQIPIQEIDVDFTKQMVLIAALGPAKTPDIDIQIKRVWREKNQIRTEILILRPADAENDVLQRRSPYHIVVVPRSDLNIEDFTTSVPKGAMARG
jgi:hypothetical protein